MRMRALVHDHAVDRGAQIGAVIEIESAQIKLVRFALAAVLADDEAGHRFQQLTGAVHRARL